MKTIDTVKLSPFNGLCSLWLLGKISYSAYAVLASSYKVNSAAALLGLPTAFLVTGGLLAVCIVLFFPFCWAVGFLVSLFGRLLDRMKCGRLLYSGQAAVLSRVLAAAGFLLLIVCSMQADLWLDEAFSMRMVSYSYREMIQFTAQDVHPPLYYILLKFVIDLFLRVSADFSFLVSVAKLFSVLAYALTILLCKIKLKEEGPFVSRLLPLCLFCGASLFGYGLEIRMYGWAMFFVTATYLFALDVMNGSAKPKTWISLISFSLCSAYIHYFALLSMAMIWLWLLVWIVRREKEALKKWLLSGCIVFSGYLPWLFVLVRQMGTVSQDYWIQTSDLPGIMECVEFLFPGPLVFVFLLTIAQAFLTRSRELKQCRDITGYIIWASTIAAGWLLSVLIRPVFISRYLLPCGFCVWISALLILKGLSDKKQAVAAGLIVAGCIVSGYQLLGSEALSGQQARAATALIVSMPEDSVIVVEGETSDHVVYTAAAYTDRKVYYFGENSESDVFLEVFDNVELIEEDGERIEALLSDGLTVYYMTANSAADTIAVENGQTGTLLGEYVFGVHTYVYVITLCAE